MSVDLNEQYDKIYRFCYLRVGQRELAEDITQETFLRFLERPQYRTVSKTLQLLYTIAGNLCADEFRRPRTDVLDEDTADMNDTEEQLLTGAALRTALSHLSDEDRELVLLRYVNEVPMKALSAVTGQSRFTLRRRLKAALAQLRGELGKEDNDESI